MVKFRPQRGSLLDAMSEYKEFNSIDEMYEFIAQSPYIDVENLSVSEIQGEDKRIGWKHWRYVCTKRVGVVRFEIPQCIGYCDLGEGL